MKKDDKNKAPRQATDSLDLCLDRLRDLHLNYKDLSQRCQIEINSNSKQKHSFGVTHI